MDMAYNFNQYGSPTSTDDFIKRWAIQQFGVPIAERTAEILHRYGILTARRKYELLSEMPFAFSTINYDEAQSNLAQWDGLLNAAQTTYDSLDQKTQTSFFQLVLHPIMAGKTMVDLYTKTAMNKLYAEQGRISTNLVAEQSQALFKEDAEIAKRYHALNNGKWDGFVNQPHIGYTSWQEPSGGVNIIPSLSYTSANQTFKGSLGIGIQGTSSSYPRTKILTLLTMSSHMPEVEVRYFDLFALGNGTTPYTVSTSNTSYINLSPTLYRHTWILRSGIETLSPEAAAEGEQLRVQVLASETEDLSLNTSRGHPPHLSNFPIFSPNTRSARSTPATRSYANMTFLRHHWRFPSDVRYCKSTLGSLQGYDQREIQNLVTSGYIVENDIGLYWTNNGRYLLRRCDEMIGSSGDVRVQQPHMPGLGSAMYAHELFSRPTSTHSDTTIPSDRATSYGDHIPIAKRILKTRPPSPTQDGGYFTPLPYRWLTSPTALYKEAYSCAMGALTQNDIEHLVTTGRLIVDEKGIRTANTNQYRFLYQGERDATEMFYTKPFTEYVFEQDHRDIPATPIVAERRAKEKGKTRVRIWASSLSLDALSIVGEERVVDNEGKTAIHVVGACKARRMRGYFDGWNRRSSFERREVVDRKTSRYVTLGELKCLLNICVEPPTVIRTIQ